MAYTLSENSNLNYKMYHYDLEIQKNLSQQKADIDEIKDDYNFIVPKLETALNCVLLDNSELKSKLEKQEKDIAKMKQKIYQLTKLIESNQDEYKKKYDFIEDSLMDLDLDIDQIKANAKNNQSP